MIDKKEIRLALLSQMNTLEVDASIIAKLEGLTIFNADKTLDMDIFYHGLGDIVSWSAINNVPIDIERKKNTENTNIVLNIIAWAIKAWDTASNTGDLKTIVVCYLLVKSLHLLPEKDLRWNLSSEKLRTSLYRVLPTMNFNISSNLPESISYSDRKYHLDSVVSGYKSNKFNWIESSFVNSQMFSLEKASFKGIFSNNDTLATCKIV